MRISGGTKILGIIGQNIAYTQSPAIHNAAIQAFGLDQVYVPFDLPQSALPHLLDAMWQAGAVGFNVTKPHKAWMAQHLKSSLSSVNTLYRGPQGWLAASTDGEGFVRGLRRIGVQLEALKRLIFLGNGGAVTGILEHLVQAKHVPEAVALLSRNPLDLSWYQQNLPHTAITNRRFTESELSSLLHDPAWQSALLVQASSAPQQGDSLDWLRPALGNFAGPLVDLCYGKQVSGLLDWAKHKGVPHQDGWSMLIEQARKSQELWWGQSLDYQTIATQLGL